MLRYLFVFVTVTLQLALSIGCAKQQFVLANTLPTESTLTQPITNSTPIEKVLEELRVRFPKDIVIGFEDPSALRPSTLRLIEDRRIKDRSATRYVTAPGKLHADDMPVPVLHPPIGQLISIF
jgi:hypothetical protein